MAKAAAINLNEAFSPPPQTTVVTPPSTYGDFLPSLSPSADTGERGSSAARRLSGQVKAMAAIKEQRASSASSYGSKRQSGAIMSVPMQQPPAPQHPSDGPTGGQANAKLPPLLHGFTPNAGASNGPSTARTGSPSAASHLQSDRQQHHHNHGSGERQQHQQQQGEAIQPLIQHPSMLPGPTPASHPYQPKRKPPSAFMRNNPMRQQLETAVALQQQQQQQQQHPRSASAGSERSHGIGMYDMPYTAQLDEIRADYGGRLPNDAQAAAFAQEVMAAAEAAIAAGRQHGMWADDGSPAAVGAGGPLGGFVAAPPWGVSSVSDLEALDSILDQLVVVDARMRKALLKGPLISFETVVPEHVMASAGRAAPQQPQPEYDKDRTFLTSVKGVAEEGAEGGGEQGAAAAEGTAAAEVEVSRLDVSALPPPPSPADFDSGLASPVGMAGSARQPARGSTEGGEAAAEGPRDSALFPAAIPNQGMHPTFTRAYLASKMAAKPQHLPPPPPATAEHLLRSRPPPFIAAPSYDQLCSQIRDVQRQYTCGTARPAGQAAAAAAGAGSAGGAGGAGPAALPAAGGTTNQYIAGLDGPTLDEVVAHQELPISLERVRPTFVALKQKAVRSASPRRRGGSPGRGQGFGGGEG